MIGIQAASSITSTIKREENALMLLAACAQLACFTQTVQDPGLFTSQYVCILPSLGSNCHHGILVHSHAQFIFLQIHINTHNTPSPQPSQWVLTKANSDWNLL